MTYEVEQAKKLNQIKCIHNKTHAYVPTYIMLSDHLSRNAFLQRKSCISNS